MVCRLLTLLVLFAGLPTTLSADVLPVDALLVGGRVLSPDGGPVSGAEVRLERLLPTYERALLRFEELLPGPEPEASRKTGTDGRFELPAPEPGMWKVVVAARGALTQEYLLEPLVDSQRLPDLTLEKARRLDVRLHGAGGEPRTAVVGAFSRGERRPAWRPQVRLATTGEDGRVSLPVGEEETLELEALAGGHPLAAWKVSGQRSVTFELPAGKPALLRVAGAQGKAVEGALVLQGSSLLPLGLTDAEGRFDFLKQPVEPGSLRVLSADGWQARIELEGSGETLRLQLEAPRMLRGTVLEAGTEAPVPGSVVWAVRGHFTVTDARGDYTLPLSLPRRFVRARAAGYLEAFGRLAPGATEAPAIGLQPESEVTGTVVDGEGNALQGVTVELGLAPQEPSSAMAARLAGRRGWRGHTSPRGAFRVPGLAAGLGYRLRFSAPRFAPQTILVPPLRPFEQRAGLDVVMHPGRRAFGWVVNEADVPVVGAKVVLRAKDKAEESAGLQYWTRGALEVEAPDAITDPEGRFELQNLAPGRYVLEATASGLAPMKVPGVRLGAEAAEVDLGTMVMIAGVTVEGRIVDADDQGLAGAGVVVELPDGLGGRWETMSGEEGLFSLADLPPRPMVLAAHREGYGAAVVTDLRPPLAEPLRLVLAAAGRVEGRVVDTRGDAVENAQIRVGTGLHIPVSIPEKGRPRARSGADGSFTLDGVQPGMISVRVSAEGYPSKSLRDLELEPGGTLSVTAVLKEGSVVEGKVTTEGGEPVSEASLRVSTRDPLSSVGSGGNTDALGRFRILGAPLGPARINVYLHGQAKLEQNVELRAGSNEVDLVLEEGFAVSGQVLTKEGAPVPGATLRLELGEGIMSDSFSSQSAQMSGTSGEFAFENIGEGTYRVRASHPELATGRSETFELAHDVEGVRVEMHRGATLSGRILGLEFDELGSLFLSSYHGDDGDTRRGDVDFEARYSFEHLTPGRWHVHAQLPSNGRAVSVEVDVPDGVESLEQDLEFTGDLTITGRVMEGGTPAASLNVGATSGEGHANANTGSDGRFRLEGLRPGEYRIMVTGRQGVYYQEELQLDQNRELSIEIPSGQVGGTVRRSDGGDPVAGVRIQLEPVRIGELDPEGLGRLIWHSHAQSDETGRFKIRRVREGDWRLVARRSGFAPAKAEISVRGGFSPEVELTLTPTEGVSFEVVRESGQPPSSWVHVALYDASGRQLSSEGLRAEEGRVRVTTVPPGHWTLAVQSDDSAAVVFPVNAPGPQGQVVLPTGGALHVQVPDLAEVAVARLVLTGPEGGPAVSIYEGTMALGQHRLYKGVGIYSNLRPGAWTYTVSHGGVTWTGAAEVVAGEMTETSP